MKRLLIIILVSGLAACAALAAFLIARPDWALRIHHKLTGFQPSELSDYHHSMKGLHFNSAQLIPEGSILLIGDSLTQSIEPNLVHAEAINYGIGGDTTFGVLDRLPLYHFDRARAVVLAIGVNDFKYRDTPAILANINEILNVIPADLPVILSLLLPVIEEDNPGLAGINERIDALNQGLRDIAEQRSNVTIWENAGMRRAGQAVPEYLAGDGLHLTPAGVAAWAAELRQALRSNGLD